MSYQNGLSYGGEIYLQGDYSTPNSLRLLETSANTYKLQKLVSGVWTDSDIAFDDEVIDTLVANSAVVTDVDLGASGTAGTLDVFPTTASKGKIHISATDASADYATNITNAAMGQATTLTIPDPGGATASFVLTEGSQTINGTKTIGTLVSTNTNIGASGTAGTLKIFPTTASKGDLKITCADQTGNTEVTLTAGAMGQATTLTIADPGGSAANVLTNKGVGGTQGAICTATISATSGTTGTTLTNVTGMSVALNPGTYAVYVYLQTVSTVNCGLKLALAYSGTTTSCVYTGDQNNGTTKGAHSTTTTIGNAVAAATAVTTDASIEGTIVVSTAGNLTVQFAQNASHADTTSVFVNSFMTVQRIA